MVTLDDMLTSGLRSALGAEWIRLQTIKIVRQPDDGIQMLKFLVLGRALKKVEHAVRTR